MVSGTIGEKINPTASQLRNKASDAKLAQDEGLVNHVLSKRDQVDSTKIKKRRVASVIRPENELSKDTLGQQGGSVRSGPGDMIFEAVIFPSAFGFDFFRWDI